MRAESRGLVVVRFPYVGTTILRQFSIQSCDFSENSLKRITCENRWSFFRHGNLIFALDLSQKTAFLHVIVTTTLFGNFAFRVGILIQFASQLHLLDPLYHRSDRKHLIKL